jgi:tungstate transport system permease protein
MVISLYTLLEITIRSISISGLATLLSALWSIPVAILLSISQSKMARLLTTIFNALVGIPTVVIGLVLYLLLSRSGPLGIVNMLYTPYAIIFGQAILITPLLISFGIEVIGVRTRDLIEMSLTFGASKRQVFTTIFEESSSRILAISILGFQRAVGELGVALMLGGNIKGLTRVFTTAIALEIQRGEFELAIYLGLILITVDFIIILILRLLGWRK